MERTKSSSAQPETSFRGRISGKKIAGLSVGYFFLIVLSAVFLFPFLVMLCISVLPNNELNLQKLFSPSGTFNIGSYATILSPENAYMRYLGNTLFVSLVTGIGIPIVSGLCAYGFAKMEFKGRNFWFAVTLATMMIPAVISIVPLYTIYARLGWINTLYPMWLPSLFGGGATNIFLMRQFMRGIPDDMLKAAKLDGANSFTIFWTIMVRLCVPIFLFVGVTSFMGSWNDFMTPYTYLNAGSENMTLALGIYYDYGPGSKSLANNAMAAGVIMILPCAILFFIFQKYLIDGVAVTGMKD